MKKEQRKNIRNSFLSAGAVFVYVILVAVFLYNGERFFSNVNSFIAPAAFLLLLVLSAAIVGALLLGKPLMLYMDGHKKSAVQLFLYSLSWLLLFVIFIFLIIIFR